MQDAHIFPFLWMRGEPEEVMRREMQAIYDCGIRAVCVEARPHKDFCGPGWWHDMDIILDEAEKRGMLVWILDDKHFPTGYANGLIETKYPERRKEYLNFNTADVFGSQRPIELNVSEMLAPPARFWDLGQPPNPERANNYLISVTALRFARGNIFTEERIDLTGSVTDGVLRCTLPRGQWQIVVVYHTCTDGGDETYINLIDSVSAHTQIEGVYEEHYRHYGDKFGKTIAGFFSDEPQFGNMPGLANTAAIVGRTKMPIPWSREIEAMLRERWGEKLPAVLPYLWQNTDTMADCARFRYDYMDCLTLLYEKNFSAAIGKWCEDHSVEYIGHVVEDSGAHARLGLGVGHYFRAMTGQHMAGIDCIGGQIVYGAPVETRSDLTVIDGEFMHYSLGRMGGSAAHLDPVKKGRCMCELFGAYGWEFGVRDEKYVLDHLLSRGVNYLVPHAFSMADYPDADCPPHFYARGHNPEYPWFQKLMVYAQTMCDALSGGMHDADVAVLYDAEAEWAGDRMPMQAVARHLQTNQIEFDFVSLDMLCRQRERYRTKVDNGVLSVNGVRFHALIVPRTEWAAAPLAIFLHENPDFPVIFADDLPKGMVGGANSAFPELVSPKHDVVALADIPGMLVEAGMAPVHVSPAFPQLTVYRYVKDGKKRFFLLNESADDVFQGSVSLPASGKKTIAHLFEGRTEALPEDATLTLQPGESCLICETADVSALPVYRPFPVTPAESSLAADLSQNWTVAAAPNEEPVAFGASETAESLHPYSDAHPKFSGVLRYEKDFTLSEVAGTEWLDCENVYEVMRVSVNGQEAGCVIRPPYRLEIGSLLRPGTNHIVIDVATTPHRDQANYPPLPFVIKYAVAEPTGLCGTVKLYK